MLSWIARASLLLAVALCSRVGEAQPLRGRLPAGESLDRRTQVVTDTLVSALAEDIVLLRARGGAIAFLLTLPSDSTVVQWSRVRRVLVDSLRARAPTDADTLVGVLTVDVRRSTPTELRLRIFIGAQWRCGDEWRGGGSGREIFVPWHDSAKPPLEQVSLDSDSLPCRSP